MPQLAKTYIKTIVSFYVDGVKHQFPVYHKMPKVFGLSLECAVNSWCMRTKDYSPESLIKYIKSKDQNTIIFTENQFKKLVNR